MGATDRNVGSREPRPPAEEVRDLLGAVSMRDTEDGDYLLLPNELKTLRAFVLGDPAIEQPRREGRTRLVYDKDRQEIVKQSRDGSVEPALPSVPDEYVAANVCSVCNGEQTPLSGGPCICEGTGTADGEMVGLRKEVFALRAVRGALEDIEQAAVHWYHHGAVIPGDENRANRRLRETLRDVLAKRGDRHALRDQEAGRQLAEWEAPATVSTETDTTASASADTQRSTEADLRKLAAKVLDRCSLQGFFELRPEIHNALVCVAEILKDGNRTPVPVASAPRDGDEPLASKLRERAALHETAVGFPIDHESALVMRHAAARLEELASAPAPTAPLSTELLERIGRQNQELAHLRAVKDAAHAWNEDLREVPRDFLRPQARALRNALVNPPDELKRPRAIEKAALALIASRWGGSGRPGQKDTAYVGLVEFDVLSQALSPSAPTESVEREGAGA